MACTWRRSTGGRCAHTGAHTEPDISGMKTKFHGWKRDNGSIPAMWSQLGSSRRGGLCGGAAVLLYMPSPQGASEKDLAVSRVLEHGLTG